jgi:hypothetical protein
VLPLARKQVESNYGSIDVFTKDYARLKTASGGGDARAGIPGLWFVQPWMQKYHGGMKFGELRRPGLANAIPGFLGGPNGNEFLDTAYYSVDKLAAVNLNDVASTAETLRTVLDAIVADERLKTFTYKGTTAWAGNDDEGEWKITTPYTQADVRNIADIFALVKERALPAKVAKSVYAFVDVFAGKAAKLAQMQSLDNAQGEAHQMGLLSVGLVTLLDFFNTNYDVRCVAHALHLFNLAFCGACLCNPRFLTRPLSLRRPRSPLARKPSASSRRIRRELSRRSPHTGPATRCAAPLLPLGARTRPPLPPSFPSLLSSLHMAGPPAKPVDPGMVVIGTSVSHSVRHSIRFNGTQRVR